MPSFTTSTALVLIVLLATCEPVESVAIGQPSTVDVLHGAVTGPRLSMGRLPPAAQLDGTFGAGYGPETWPHCNQ